MNVAKILLLQIILTIALTERTTVVKITLSLCYTTWRTRKWRKFYTLTTSLLMTPLGLPEVLLDRSFVVIFTLKYCVLVFYKKICYKEGEVWRKCFSNIVIVTLVTQGFFRLLSSPVLLRKFTSRKQLSRNASFFVGRSVAWRSKEQLHMSRETIETN